jgi:hypothetical protein
MITPGVLVAALLVAGPSLWRAGAGQLAVDTALVHFLLAVVLVAAGRALLRAVVGAYAPPGGGARPGLGGDGTAVSVRSSGPAGSAASAASAGRLPRRRRTDAEPQPHPGIP